MKPLLPLSTGTDATRTDATRTDATRTDATRTDAIGTATLRVVTTAIALLIVLAAPLFAAAQLNGYLMVWNESSQDTDLYSFPFPPQGPLQLTHLLTLDEEVSASTVDPQGRLHVLVASTLYLLDPESGSLTSAIVIQLPLDANGTDIAFDRTGRLWLLVSGALWEIDPVTGQATEVLILPYDFLVHNLVDHQGLLYLSGLDLATFDPQTAELTVLFDYDGFGFECHPSTRGLVSNDVGLWSVVMRWCAFGTDRIWMFLERYRWDASEVDSEWLSELSFVDWREHEVRGFELFRQQQQAQVPALAPIGMALLTALLAIGGALLIRSRL